MSELHHECGIAAVYHFGQDTVSPLIHPYGPQEASKLIPRMLLDIQNRGQLAAGMTTYKGTGNELLLTHKNVGLVSEVFRMGRKEKYKKLMDAHVGPAAIGHVRYATCGKEDPSYAQPFERSHLEKKKWFAFGFNGQLANHAALRKEICDEGDFHFARETDTETLMHLISQEIAESTDNDLCSIISRFSERLDGSYNITFLNSLGQMFVSRDPNGFRPLCYAVRDGFFAAASESVALTNLGFQPDEVIDLDAGCAVIIENGTLRVERYAPTTKLSHCFFEWIYFANVCSRIDQQSVYLSRKVLGDELALQERESTENAIVVPVPDTAKAAAEGMAFSLGIPCHEGLMRHRALGRTFIEGDDREAKARMKYIPLPEVLKGKRVFLVDDTIVRSTTMRVLVDQIRTKGGAAEVHIRVACPPIMSPCFYGIDMSNIGDLFAPKFAAQGETITPEIEARMAKHFNADSLRYLPVSSISNALNKDPDQLCQACLTGEYPTPAGQDLYQLTLNISKSGSTSDRRLIEGVALQAELPPARL
ncbi:amidophosphoribosyltransferase [Planctomicrobium sp. SH668]|uniref:amidophosphoribosyltransferase n=1 Tax=Planctomicrobium sp. SH668 TaxID=3448126 RepID=UPI003F5B80D3